MSRLVVVSNRVCSPRSQGKAGGLAMAIKSALGDCGGLWFGWSGQVRESPDTEPAVERSNLFSLATLDLSRREFNGYYTEFSNRTLWPLFHGRVDLCRTDRHAYDIYRQVNRRFAQALYALLGPADMVWVQDYHLIPLGQELRHLGLMVPLGFFLHIPFPRSEEVAALPFRRELLSGLCAYDLVGFQTPTCATNFRAAVGRYLGGAVRQDGTVASNGQTVDVEAFPVGIDTRAFMEMANSPDARRCSDQLRAAMRERVWLCSVDRLDYTKGIAEINGRFGTFDWTPIRYFDSTFDQEQLAALHRVSRVGLVTPLRDGMNLVAKEYVAAQDPGDPGILVLSRFAGAAQELTDAIIVNPGDTGAVARSLRCALRMPQSERRARWERMIRRLEHHDIKCWRQSFVDRLAARGSLSHPLVEAS
jgi:trehalose 6-phosphate synthase